MYHAIDTGLTIIIFYLISYFFCRIGFYSQQFHRKLWNSLLAIAFISTVVAGLFLALQINYKWNIPSVKTILKWHVEFGIGLAFTGLIHFIWHLSYFGKIFWKQEVLKEKTDYKKQAIQEISSNLFIVGYVSSSIQFLLIREVMNIAGGYELITGTFLGSWLIASAIGASLGGKSQMNDIRKINLVFSISPVISFFFLLFFSRLFLNSGETPSFLVSMIFTFLVIIPFCLTSGFTFVKLISAARSVNNFTPGRSFSIETVGGIVSGVLISMLTSGFLNTYQLLLLTILLSITYTLLAFYITKYNSKFSLKILIALVAACIIIFNPDVFFRQILHPGISVTLTKDTPYGNISKGSYNGEESVFYNQRLISFNNDVIQSEEDVHYAMLQSESPGKVVVISGSIRSCLPEIMKYPVNKITYIERDPALVKSVIKIDSIPGALNIENTDAFTYIRNTREKADVILLLLPPPSTLLLNKYYTTEFFGEVKKRLNVNGIFMCSPGPGDTYFNKESLNLYSSIYNSLATVFKNIKPVIGNKIYFIASDKDLTLSFCKLTETRNIRNTYVCSDYLSDDLISKKSDEFNKLLDHGIKQNSFAFPVASFHFQTYNFSKYLDEKIPAVVCLLLLFALPVFTIKGKNLVMYFSASALAGFEIIMLLTLQLLMGNMFQLTGLVIAGLMTGLAIGAGTNMTFISSYSFVKRIFFLVLFYLGFGLLYNYLLEVKSSLPAILLILFFVFIPALCTGHIFRELTLRIDENLSISEIYSADLAGSALGFIFISGIAIPVFGIQISIFIISFLVFVGFLFGAIRNKL